MSDRCHPSLARFTLARVSLMRASLARFPFLCLTVDGVWCVARIAFVGICEEVFYACISFLRIYPMCVVHHLFTNLVNVSSRQHHNGLVY